eukprot:scaffold47468_cov35-Prasinocladus_malaysianus.AAC.1
MERFVPDEYAAVGLLNTSRTSGDVGLAGLADTGLCRRFFTLRRGAPSDGVLLSGLIGLGFCALLTCLDEKSIRSSRRGRSFLGG